MLQIVAWTQSFLWALIHGSELGPFSRKASIQLIKLLY